MSLVNKFFLPNGIRVLFQKATGAKSVSVGLWVKIGSRHETNSQRGYTHFVEHMLFKGTKRRSARQIAEEIDQIGGYLNAATSREDTYFFVTLIKHKIELAFDILSDMVFESIIDEKEVKSEASVILEELIGYEEDLEDYIYDFFYKNFLNHESLGLHILGKRESIQSATPESIKEYYKNYYIPERMTLVVVGDCNSKTIESLAWKYFSEFQKKGKPLPKLITPKKSFSGYLEKREIEQALILFGLEGVKKDFDLEVKMSLFSHILGGGMSSRLFQKIREEKGLCYSISSYSDSYEDTGVFSIYCRTSNSKLTSCVNYILEELRNLKSKGFTLKELENAKTNQIGSLAIAYETPEAKMTDIALQEIYFNHFYSIRDRIKAIQKITLEELNSFIHQILEDKVHISVLGRIGERKLNTLDLSLI